MVLSMTAFARQAGEGEWGRAVWELRSVNHRYLELALRLPEELRALEPALRERIAQRIQRGKIECMLRFEPGTGAAPAPRIQHALLQQLVAACQEVERLTDHPAPLNALDLLRWPGVLALAPLDPDRVGEVLLGLLDQALTALVEARGREGRRLQQIIEERCRAAQQQVQRLRERLPAIVEGLRERLARVAVDASLSLDPVRLEQEILLLVQRLDVAEEMDRLQLHLHELSRLAAGAGAVGRKLDFLLQEMNREANTIASKATHIDTTGAAVELKVLIEQMREQVQNIE